MFGLEDKKKKATDVFVFDFEKELKDPKKLKEALKKIEERLQQIKSVLREGDDQETFNKYGVLLHGYTSLIKVTTRVNAKK